MHKDGCTNELVEWFKSWPEYGLPIPPHGWRVYSHSQFSPWDVVVNEIGFESLAEHETWWKEYWAAPRVREDMDRMAEIAERGDLWTMEQVK